MASGAPPPGGSPRDAREPAGDGVVWHSTCGYAACVEPSHYAADSICKGCRRIKYCTFACQKADWKRHRLACKADEAADDAAAREGALVVRPRARPPPTPGLLFEAAHDGNLKHVEALLRLGADVNEDVGDVTPLYAASSFGHVAIVSALLAVPGIDVNAALPDGSTPLSIASEHGHLAIVSALLAAPGVSVNAAQKEGLTPLHWAAWKGRAAVVSALLAHPTVTVNPRSKRARGLFSAGSTPLRLARNKGHLGIVTLLKACGGVA